MAQSGQVIDTTASPSRPRWKLQVDHRERGSRLVELLKDSDAFELQMCALKAGDYILNDRIVVERKTHTDFALSIIDGRLFHQAAELTRTRQPALILVEGPKPAAMPRMHPHALKGAILSLAVAWRLPVVFSRDPNESCLMLNMLAEQSQAVSKPVLSRHGSRPPRPYARQLFVLQGLPGVGPKLAKSLLSSFGSVEAAMRAEEAELAKVEGCGPKKAAAIRRVLGNN
ncbi:MAG TPA: ERCC4 domain-containing protein [Acidobacteriota bacterium]|jgi:Fanconi anemia group M protein